MARSFSTKLTAVCPLSLTVSIWTLSDSLLVISGRFNCLSGDITFLVASEADRALWFDGGVVVPVGSEKLDARCTFECRFTRRIEEHLITVTTSHTRTVESKIAYTTAYGFLFPIKGLFTNHIQFFASCHQLAVECNQHTYVSRSLARAHTETRPLATKARGIIIIIIIIIIINI
jgi:hypothetical protein